MRSGRCELIIEEPARDRARWIRTIGAATAAAAILAAGAVVWEYGRLAGDDLDAGCILSLAGLVHAIAPKWLRERDRRADLRWRRALVLLGGVHPGLRARWSRAAFAIDAFVAAGFVSSTLLHFGGQVGAGSRWYGPIGSVAAGALTVVVAVSAFRRLRASGYVVVTSQGVAHRGRLIDWARIRSVNRNKKGVYLRLNSPSEDPRYVEFGNTDCAVPDERLAEVIEFYLTNPHRRSALDTGP